MTRMALALGTMLLCTSPLSAQDPMRDEATRWSAGAGFSILTGTPHRPRPLEGEALTGASGPEQGFHVRVSGERLVRPWLLAGVEASYNRLTTSVTTYNCLPETTTCYPAAGVDELLAIQAVARIESTRRVAPFATLGAGAGAFRLEVDEPFEDSELQDRTGVRPVVRIGTGVAYELGEYLLSLEASFQATIGRGGGTHHIPLTLSVSF